MAGNLNTLDSVGGFSVSNKVIVNHTYDATNLNSLEVKNAFYDDSFAQHYILRGTNTSTLSVDNVNGILSIPSNTMNFVESVVVAVNDDNTASITQKLESALQCDTSGVVTELSTMTTIIKDSIPTGQTWEIELFTGGGANKFSYATTTIRTTKTVKWAVYTKVVSIDWT